MKNRSYFFIKILVILILSINIATAQKSTLAGKEIDEIKTFMWEYAKWYRTLTGPQNEFDDKKFLSFFLYDYTNVPIDYTNDITEINELAAYDYINGLTAPFADSLITDFDIKIDEDNFYYCKGDNYWYVWVNKILYYYIGKHSTLKTYVESNIRLHLVKHNGSFKIYQIEKVKNIPSDYDGDFIPEYDEKKKKCDSCYGELPGKKVNIYGCEIADSDGDGVLDTQDSCDNTPGIKRKNGCPVANPAYKFALNFSGGVAWPMSGTYTNTNLVSNSNWEKKGMFALTGFAINGSLSYNFHRMQSLTIGSFFFDQNFNTSALTEQVKFFLVKNNVIVDNIEAKTQAYKMLIPYLGYRLGNFNSSGASVCIEPFIGFAFTGLFKNTLYIDVTYQDYPDQHVPVSLETKPFFIYGAKGNLEIPLGDVVNLTFSGYIARGKYNLVDQNISFPAPSSKLAFSPTPMRIYGIMAGLSFKLNSYDQKYKPVK